ncbi:hypothetical protein [Algisphaera agarilytica]|uniref:Uncharacterized protein n=1 Tax=Algisphaera agarilytica TaxID=1385975 RepID=A0A7X0H9M7_9BACT|nr:hypothetical protein [Algisphaera agarilytica]MBB6430701.1 hypothetical protein [Algisphaera agarilytica]
MSVFRRIDVGAYMWCAVCGAILIAAAGCSTSTQEANPQTVFNDFCNILLAGDGRALSPIDINPPVPVVPLESDDVEGDSTAKGETLSPTDGMEDAEQVLLSAALVEGVMPVAGKGRLTAIDESEGVFFIECSEFSADDALFQVRFDLCWISTVRMLESYEDGETRDVETILSEVRGEDAIDFEQGQNNGNVYEIVRALNPKLQGYDREIAYLTVNSLNLKGAQSEELWGYGLLQAQRYLDHFMGAEAILSSLAAGEPVIVGMMRPKPEGHGGGIFGHAMLVYAAEFVAIPSSESTEIQLYRIENLIDSIVIGRQLWENNGELDANPDTLDQVKGVGKKVWGGTKKAWRSITSGDKEVDRPFRLALHKVYLVDPLGRHPDFSFDEKVEIDGPEFRDQLIYALNRDMARKIVPIVDEAELDVIVGGVD